jgi:transcriptional regulator with XRE-family HTH domain
MDYMDMADLLGISDGHYRKIERGIYGLDARKLLLLYCNLKVDPLYILTGDQGRQLQHVPLNNQSDRDALVCELLDYCKKQLVQKEE